MPACILMFFGIFAVSLPVLPKSLVLVCGDRVVYERTLEDDTFRVGFRHSVNKGDIYEAYRIDRQNSLITLEHCYFQNYGAGMLDTSDVTPEMNFRKEGDYYVIDFPANWRGSIGYIGGNTAKHVFYYQDDELPFGEMYFQKPLTICVMRRSMLDRLLSKA